MWIVAGGQTVETVQWSDLWVVRGVKTRVEDELIVPTPPRNIILTQPDMEAMFDNAWNGEYNIQKRCWIVFFFVILSQKALVSAFSKHCTLHSAHFQTSLTCLPLKTGPLTCSAPGPGWVHIPATAGGELVVARRAAGNRKISWNSNQCSNKCCLLLPKLHHLT